MSFASLNSSTTISDFIKSSVMEVRGFQFVKSDLLLRSLFTLLFSCDQSDQIGFVCLDISGVSEWVAVVWRLASLSNLWCSSRNPSLLLLKI